MSKTALVHARIFDGETVLADTTVVLEGAIILSVGGDIPSDAEVMDVSGATLMPGLIDAHVHTSLDSLALALTFGVTTELEMQGALTKHNREAVTNNDRVADVRSAGFGLTPPGGHPSELFHREESDEHGDGGEGEPAPRGGEGEQSGENPWANIIMPFSTTPDEAVAFIPQLAESGSDYIKFMIDDGTVEGAPGLPALDHATVAAGVAEAHRLGLLTVAHALAIDATVSAIDAGIDGLAHLFMDKPSTPEVIELIARSGAFVVPCAVLNASMMGITGEIFAADPRVSSRLGEAWLSTLKSSFNKYPEGNLDDVLASVKALSEAGVDVLVGTDASVPVPSFGGLAHGASVHHELQLLVRAGLSPVQALRAATATTARRFGLTDRGRIAPGLRADLLLVDGDPTTEITDTLNIRQVWRRGAALLPA